ncbi:hypothetical protein JR316_0006657 [Psilocybe cubensis]|uniref:Uncharacterized protein n=2 Tax=Psilocybe cubensis TaxID=181762 RepID=A0ACB8GX70_PSICU|nr:hypothetical protein JR316_0006657 [Psilocybe cubensis]KAH9480060.1 hypothetical protein JR316_0006657 [Psilocybe cubensis]
MLLPSTTDDSLFDGLSPGDLYRYGRTCKRAHDAVNSFIRRKFHLHGLLERYFQPNDVFDFRRLQAKTGMFISGSTALQFLDRVVYPESDLDLYLEHRYRHVVALWLTQAGYRYTPPVTYPDETLDEALELVSDLPRLDGMFYTITPKGYFGAAIVLNFEKQNPCRKIQLITSHHSPLQLVLNYHSTCVMNIITHEKAYSLYPRGTFDERRSLLNLPLKSERLQVATTKYSARGWKIVSKISTEEFENPRSAFSHGLRYIGDGKCWTLSILPKLNLPDSTIETNSWVHLYDSDLVPTMSATVFVSGRLRYGYLIGDEPLRRYVSHVSDAFDGNYRSGEQQLDYIFSKMIEHFRQRKKANRDPVDSLGDENAPRETRSDFADTNTE